MNTPIKILIVDDEVKACNNLKRFLDRTGFVVDVAHNGEDALDKIEGFDPRVILLDVKMPGLTGDELVKMIKEWKPKIHVIMVSGVKNSDIKRECFDKGAFAFLEKPVKLDLLKNTIDEALGSGDENS